ncbi:MAG: type VII secretion protein EccCa [Cellulomonadaceae bacterium]|nr:type VII secretion protein EccCa [Cellulomonadaceae bacterium]
MPSSRLAPPRAHTGTVVLQAPPELAAGDDTSSLLTSMLPMLGTVGAVVMVTMSNSGAKGLLTGGMFLMSSLGFVAANGWRQRAQRSSQVLNARREYLAYLSELRRTVRVAARQQRRATNWVYPAPSTLVYLAEEQTRVWERGPGDKDFLDLRIGVSEQPSTLVLEAPELPPLAQLDPVAASAAHRFMITHETQPNIPVGLRVAAYSRVEITGPEAEGRALARSMVLGAAVLHHPEDLVVAVVADPSVLGQWEWAKWLPHVHSRRVEDGAGPARMIVSSYDDLMDLLPESLAARTRFSGGSSAAPHLLVVTDGVARPLAELRLDGLDGVTVLDLPLRWGALAEDDVARISLSVGAAGTLAEVIDLRTGGRTVVPDTCSTTEAEATARRLMPLYAGPAAVQARATEQLDLTQLLGQPDIRDIDLDVAWRGRLERDRLRVPIGQDTHGAPLVLDLKESAQQGMGPHGVLIGATGSGKSEVLRTLVLALTLTHSPEELNLVLVDFKGGATFAGMAGMPHVSAIITNLGQELSLVDRFQDALQGEIVRRQELLRAAGNFANVGDYERARKAGRTDLAPLPALLVVVDEFSELLSAKPEFVDSFVNIGRVGRSLHVHLLMASQRLEEGKLRGLDTYLSYRVGLRTFSGAESRAVLGVPDAVDLPREPGVGYLKYSSDGMTQFKAAYVSGALRRRSADEQHRVEAGLATITAFTAAPVVAAEPDVDVDRSLAGGPVEGLPVQETGTVFDVAVGLMAGRGPEAHRVWLPPLEVPETFDALMPDLAVDPVLGLVSRAWREAGDFTVPLGVVDKPLEQRRDPFVVSLAGSAGHMAVVGRPQSGKSTVVRSLVAALALTHTPQEVQVYVLDFGGGTFVGLQDLPHVSGVAARTDVEVVRRVVAEVSQVVDRREVYFREQGIDSIETYRRRRAAGTADDGWGEVFLVVDGYGTLRSEFEALEPAIAGIAARGLGYGVHLVVTATRWFEMRPQIKDPIGTRLELRLGDPGDSEVDRKLAANVPASAPGRGVTADRLHMLAALPRLDGSGDPGTLADGVADLVARVRSAWHGPTGPRLRLLPQLVSLDEVRTRAGAADRRLLLGVDEAALAPFGLDLASESHLYLFGESDSGKTSALRGVAAEIQRLYRPDEAKIFVVDYRRGLLGEIPDAYLGAYLSSDALATGGLRDLAAFFAARMPGPDVTPEQLRARSWWAGAKGFILVDDYDLVATSQGNPLAPIVPLLAQAGDLGLHLVVARHTGGASRASFDPVLQRLTDLGTTGMLLSGNPDEGGLIGRVKAVQSVPGRVQVVSRDRGLFTGHLAFVPSEHG